jgi:hypothetical protein
MKKLICALTFLSCSNLLFAFDPAPSNYEIAISSGLKLSSQTKHEEDAQAKYTFNVKYPQFVGNPLEKGAQQFNQEIGQFVTSEINEFENKVADAANTSKIVPPDLDKNSFELNFQAGVFKIQDNKIVSIRFNKEYSYAGDAHPSHEVEVYNFNLMTGKKMQLADLFKPQSDYLKLLSTICYKELNKRFKTADEQVLEKGTAPKIENFDNWNLTPDGLLIIFDEYQVASYVDGQPEVFIPYKTLAKIILPSSIVETCIKDPKQCSAV